MLGQVMTVLGLLVGVRLLTELLNPAAYGELALGITMATFVNQTLFGPLVGGITRFYAPAVEQSDIGGYLKAVRRILWLVNSILIPLILLLLGCLLIVDRKEWIVIVVATFIFAVIGGYNSILSGIQSAARQRFIVAFHQGIESWLRFLAAAGLIWWLGATSSVAMIGYAVASFVVLGSQYMFFRALGTQRVSVEGSKKKWLERIWSFSWPISVFGIFTWMQLVSDRWALDYFSTTQEVGKYAVLFQLGYYPMSMVSGMAMQFLVPIVYQRAGDASDSGRNANVISLNWRLTWLTLAITGGAFLFAMIFHTQIFRFFVAKEYLSVSYLLPWMLLAGGVMAASQTIALNLMSQMKTRTMMTAKIVTALLGTALNCAGAYRYGTLGIVAAGNLFSVLHFAWMALLSYQNGEKNCI